MTLHKTVVTSIFLLGLNSLLYSQDFFSTNGHIASSVGIGVSAGVPGWNPEKLINITHDSQYNKLATFYLFDYQRDSVVVEGRYGFSSNFGLFATSPEYENHLSVLIGLATLPGVFNASLLSGIGVDVGSRHGDLVSWAYWNNTYIDNRYFVPSIPLELNLSMLFWGWGIGFQYHGELNSAFTSTTFCLLFRHQS